MSLQQERPPAYSHDPESLELPSVPQQAPPRGNATLSIHLPDLKSLGLPEATHTANHSYNGPAQYSTVDWRSSPALQHNDFPRVPSAAPRSSVEMDISSPRESIMSVEEQGNRAPSVVSIEDPDVRIAAEALSGLGNPEFVRSPSNRSTTLPSQSSPISHPRNASSMSHTQEPEPLLQLLTTTHPWLGGTINGSLSAYETTKSYTPRFVQASATYLERNIGSPVANTVGAVGRRTGVEGGLRRYLGDRRPSDLERGDADEEDRHKRRRVASPQTTPNSMAMDVEPGFHQTQGPLMMPLTRPRTDSRDSTAESLPAYDDNRSPQYEERSEAEHSREQARRQQHWSTQLMITTSGLGVAMSDTSLRSLKYCLGILRRATNHLGSVMRALRLVLEDYERATAAASNSSNDQQQQQQSTSPNDNAAANEEAAHPEPITQQHPNDAEAQRLAARIQALTSDILQTLKTVVNTVSRYTGGALPTNAANFVRSQLLSVPERWRVAAQSTRDSAAAGQPETVRRTNRMLAFAKEGLDMVAQVSMTVEGTIGSAEAWLESMGRRGNGGQEEGSEKNGAREEGAGEPMLVDVKVEKTGL